MWSCDMCGSTFFDPDYQWHWDNVDGENWDHYCQPHCPRCGAIEIGEVNEDGDEEFC